MSKADTREDTAEPDETQRRGWVEVYPVDGRFQVYDWSEHYDSGAIVARHAAREDAVTAARAWGARHRRKLGETVA